MKKINNKKTIIILLVLCIGLIGLTIAYFSNSTILDNLFSTKPYETTYTETFVSPDNWLPGGATEKTIIVTNSGQVDEAVRISYIESWISNNGTTLSGLIDSNDLLTDIEENSEKAAIINFSNTDDWTYNNGYEIGRDNEDNNVGTISYYKSNDCYYNSDYDKNTTGCNSNYDTSNIKNVIDNWSNTFNDVLEEINGYKARLIKIDELNKMWHVYFSTTSSPVAQKS